jgi:hypothetical protein
VPIVNTDAKALEWATYLFLSQESIGIPEWNNVLLYPDKYDDVHTTNQKQFNLPSRLIAKNYYSEVFMLILIKLHLHLAEIQNSLQ